MGVGTTVGIWTVGVGTAVRMGSVRTTDPAWLAATTPVPSPKRRRRVSARLFGHSSIEVARRARFPTLIRHEVRLPHLAHRVISLRCGAWSPSAHSGHGVGRAALPVTATTDFLEPDTLNKCGGAVPAQTHILHRTRTTDAEGPPSLDGPRQRITDDLDPLLWAVPKILSLIHVN